MRAGHPEATDITQSPFRCIRPVTRQTAAPIGRRSRNQVSPSSPGQWPEHAGCKASPLPNLDDMCQHIGCAVTVGCVRRLRPSPCLRFPLTRSRVGRDLWSAARRWMHVRTGAEHGGTHRERSRRGKESRPTSRGANHTISGRTSRPSATAWPSLLTMPVLPRHSSQAITTRHDMSRVSTAKRWLSASVRRCPPRCR